MAQQSQFYKIKVLLYFIVITILFSIRGLIILPDLCQLNIIARKDPTIITQNFCTFQDV